MCLKKKDQWWSRIISKTPFFDREFYSPSSVLQSCCEAERLFIKEHRSISISWISKPENCCNYLTLPCSFTVVFLGKAENSFWKYFLCYFWVFCWCDILLWCPLLHNNIMSSAMTSQCRENMEVCNCLPAVHIWWKVCMRVTHSVCHGSH